MTLFVCNLTWCMVITTPFDHTGWSKHTANQCWWFVSHKPQAISQKQSLTFGKKETTSTGSHGVHMGRSAANKMGGFLFPFSWNARQGVRYVRFEKASDYQRARFYTIAYCHAWAKAVCVKILLLSIIISIKEASALIYTHWGME